jgi:hypothetical protein
MYGITLKEIMLGLPAIILSLLPLAYAQTTMKTYQDFGLGFKMVYPTGMIIEKGRILDSNNITIYYPTVSTTDNYITIQVTATPASSSLMSDNNFNAYDLNQTAR